MKKLLFFIFILTINIQASWIYFYSPDCPHCEQLLDFLDNKITNQVKKLNLEIPTNYHQFLTEAAFRMETNAWPRQLPILMTDTKIFRGEEKIVAFFSDDKKTVPKEKRLQLKMFSIGLIDGINPCAFALMIFVCAALRLSGRRSKALFLGAIVFVISVAATYLLLGWGLLHGLRKFMITPFMRSIVYAIFSLFTFGAAVLSIINVIKNRRYGGIPLKWRRWLQRNIRKNVRFGTGLIVIAAMGVVAAAIESVCTGQVYLPALLILEREQGQTLSAIFSLLLYNFGFIIPLLLVALGAVLGLKAVQLERWGRTQLIWANSILFLLFLLFSIFLLFWSFEEFSRYSWNKEKEKKNYENKVIKISQSNAEIIVKTKIGKLKSKPVLFQTESGDLYWLFENIAVSVDFWKPVFVSIPIEKNFPSKDFFVLEKSQEINNQILEKEHSEYVGAISWWISRQQKNGEAAYKIIPTKNLYDMISKACGSCGEATGFRLITSRFGFKSYLSSKKIASLDKKSLPIVATWNSEGIHHAAVILEKLAKDNWLQVRFLENSEPVFVRATVPNSAKAWVIKSEKQPIPSH